MTDREALLQLVLNDPADDTPRLVLADWMDENGEADFGRFLRAGVVAARYRHAETGDYPDLRYAVEDLAAVCGGGAPARWVADTGVGPAPADAEYHFSDDTPDVVTVRFGATAVEFARGLVAGLTVPLDAWYAAAGRVLDAWPLERVAPADLPGVVLWIDPPGGDRPVWSLTASLTVHPRRGAARRGWWRRLVASLGDDGTEYEFPPQPLRFSAGVSFPDRSDLAAAAAAASAHLMTELRGEANTWWPAPAPL